MTGSCFTFINSYSSIHIHHDCFGVLSIYSVQSIFLLDDILFDVCMTLPASDSSIKTKINQINHRIHLFASIGNSSCFIF